MKTKGYIFWPLLPSPPPWRGGKLFTKIKKTWKNFVGVTGKKEQKKKKREEEKEIGVKKREGFFKNLKGGGGIFQ